MREIPETGLRQDRSRRPTRLSIPYRQNEGDTGNGIETDRLHVIPFVGHRYSQNEGDTGNGIETGYGAASLRPA